MKVKRSKKTLDPSAPDFRWHLFFYSYPGAGKTKFFVDWKDAGFNPVVVATYEHDITLEGSGIPILTVEHPDELTAIVKKPRNVIEQVLWKELGEEYPVDTFCFDILRDLQLLLFGEPKTLKDIEVFEGAVVLEKSKGYGIMSEPNARDASNIPSPKDYRLLDIQLRGLIRAIEKMPYHTITTAHAEVNYDQRTHMKLTGDPKKDKEIKANATISGFPSIEGYATKADIPGLVSDFLIYLDTPDQENFYMYPKPSKGFFARTRVAEFMPRVVDWTGKNGYEVLVSEIEKGKKRLKK